MQSIYNTYSKKRQDRVVNRHSLPGVAPAMNWTFSDSVTSSVLHSALYKQNAIPSASFGLHIGSVRHLIPPPFTFRGYDHSRVMGTVALTYCNPRCDSKIDILDIGLGCAEVCSPLPEGSQASGLLAQCNSSITDSIQVIVESIPPFTFLSRSTCAAIRTLLTVSFDSDFGLYIWNTT